MPELPEVETSVRMLKQKVLNRTFVCLWAEDERKLKAIKPLSGKRIKDIERIGKGIFFHLDDGSYLFTHLKMTGHFLSGEWFLEECPLTREKQWKSKDKLLQEKKNGYLKFVFLMDDNKQLALSDPRKFAVVSLMTAQEKEKYQQKLGPDALEITEEQFIKVVKQKRKPIKAVLMDQQTIAGVGNIYAAEILFKSKIDPRRRADRVSVKNLAKVHHYMQQLLKKGIELKGDSTSDFRLIDGSKGGYQNYHLVYNLKGNNCPECEGVIKRCVVGGRGTYYCSCCQK